MSRRSGCLSKMLYFDINAKVPLALGEDDVTALFNRAEKMLLAENAEDKLISIVVVGPREMKKINLATRGKEEATDVLAFPLEKADSFVTAPFVNTFFGEIVICPSVARRKAKLRGMTAPEYQRLILAHGLLHLFGMDHKKKVDAEKMEQMEKKILVV